MTDIVSNLSKIQQEEVKFRASVSEATMTKVGGSINAIIENGPESIGTIVQSILTEAQFQSIRGTQWVRMSGQSIVGSDLETLTGISALPDAISDGTFFRQAVNEVNIGDYEDSQNKSHTHSTEMFHNQVGSDGGVYARGETVGATSISYTTSSEGGSEARPNNLKVNFFIKINN